MNVKLPFEALGLGGWSELASLFVVVGSVAALTSTAVVTWLRFRLRHYFVTKPDHLLMVARLDGDHTELVEKLAGEHTENRRRIEAVEVGMISLATQHSVKNIVQNQAAMGEQLIKLREGQAAMSSTIAGQTDSNNRVERMMNMVLDHMLERDKP